MFLEISQNSQENPKFTEKHLYQSLFFNKFAGFSCNFSYSVCKLLDETIIHLFYDCLFVKSIWNQLKSILSNNLIFPINTPQSAIFGFWDLDTNEHLILNNLLLIFKIYIYNVRKTGYLNISHLLIYIKGINDTKKKLCENNAKRRKKLTKSGKMF